MSLNAIFNRYYKEKLQPHGFRKLKKCDGFGRILKEEVFQYVILVKQWSPVKNSEAFALISGVLSLYSADLSMEYLTTQGKMFYDYAVLYPEQEDLLKQLKFLRCHNNAEATKQVHQTFRIFSKYILPYWNRIRTLNDYIAYCKKMNPSILRYDEETTSWNDFILLIKANNHEDFMDLYEERCNRQLQKYFDGHADDPAYQQVQASLYDALVVQTAHARDNIYDNPVLYRQIEEEWNRRWETNRLQLRAYGFPFPQKG